jgi:hypothetical protein
MAALKAEGVIEVACSGYCFGGMCSRRHLSLRDNLSHSDAARYTFDLAFDRLIKVAVVAHPSLLKRPEDLLVRLARSVGCIAS